MSTVALKCKTQKRKENAKTLGPEVQMQHTKTKRIGPVVQIQHTKTKASSPEVQHTNTKRKCKNKNKNIQPWSANTTYKKRGAALRCKTQTYKN